MKAAGTRATAARLLANLLNQQSSLAALLPAARDRVAPRDRALLQELCYGSCRWYFQLQCYLDGLLDKPLRDKDRDIHALMIVGLYQLIHTRVPDHAAINDTVAGCRELKKPWARGLVNAVLRRFRREQSKLEARLNVDRTCRLAHPRWLLQAIEQSWSVQAESVFAANNQHPPLTLRVNRRLIHRNDLREKLASAGIETRPTTYSSDGLTLPKPTAVEELPGYREGWFSVQDEAPQLSASLLELADGQRVLDACCAPGGKTSHLLEQPAKLGQVVGFDTGEERLKRTRENLARLGVHAQLHALDARRAHRDWQGPRFHRILVDSPCSATGILRRQPDVKLLRREEDIPRLVQQQDEILDSTWELLEPGGLLLYATCSILPTENSETIGRFLQRHAGARHAVIEADWGIPQPQGRQLLPQIDGADGFYYAKLWKQL